MTVFQQELFAREPLTPETFSHRLPAGDWVTISDVCVAYGGMSWDVVESWVRSGRIRGIDARSDGATKPYWRLFRQSVIDDFHTRLSGATPEKQKKGPNT
ncbi:MAG: hypothetical protein V1929_00205 [bacterium]